MKQFCFFLYGLLSMLLFSCTAGDEMLNIEQSGNLNPSSYEQDVFALKLSDEYDPNGAYIDLTPDDPDNMYFVGMWQLQYYDEALMEWVFAAKDSDYDMGVFDGTNFRLKKSNFNYGTVRFRGRKIKGFEYMDEEHEISGCVTPWTMSCSVFNNYMKEAGVITESDIVIVLDFVFTSTDYEAKRIGKATYAKGFNAVMEGNFPGGNIKVPAPTVNTATSAYRYRYAYKLDKGDFPSYEILSIGVRNLNPDWMVWEDQYFSTSVSSVHEPIIKTIPVTVVKHDDDDYIYDDIDY